MEYSFDISAVNEICTNNYSIEELGTKEKIWLENKQYLFKRGRVGTGEDWAEVVAYHICKLLGIPCAQYAFAVDEYGNTGVLTKSIVPEGCKLSLGNEWLAKSDSNYDKNTKYKQYDYELNRLCSLFYNKKPQLPLTYTNELCINSSFGIFTAYLLLDALIGNQDRHHENWGFIVCSEKVYLAETFDHASSLGRLESNERKRYILEKRDKRFTMEQYCARAKTPLYTQDTTPKRINTVDAFFQSSSLISCEIHPLLTRLEKFITYNSLLNIFLHLPQIQNFPTDIDCNFAIEMVLENKKRLLSGGL